MRVQETCAEVFSLLIVERPDGERGATNRGRSCFHLRDSQTPVPTQMGDQPVRLDAPLPSPTATTIRV